MNATSEIANQAFELMKESTKYVMCRLKNQPVKYQLFIHGQDSSSGKISLDSELTDFIVLSDTVDQLTKGTENIPALHKDLEKMQEAFKSNSSRQHAEKVGDVLALLWDSKYLVFWYAFLTNCWRFFNFDISLYFSVRRATGLLVFLYYFSAIVVT